MKCPHCGKQIAYGFVRIRSLQQNKFYWGGILQILCDELGYSKDEMHAILKSKFLGEIKFVKTKDGFEEVRVSKSTTGLSTIEIEEFFDQIRQWAVENFGILIPMPNEE